MENVKRICWDCPNEPVTDWKVNNVQERREGHLLTISCSKCGKESQVFGWMVGCEGDTCKNQSIGAAK